MINMNTVSFRHSNVTVAYRTSVFNTKRREVMKQIKFFLNKRRFKQHVRGITAKLSYVS
jgi:protein involved in ribonucleotide reduction